MRAAVIGRHGEVPDYTSHPTPQRGPGQVLVRVTAAPVNPLDLLCASGTSYFGPPPLPYVPGTQGVGVVAETSNIEVKGGAGGLRTGQRIWFSVSAGMQPGDGGLAEFCAVDQANVFPLPDAVSDDLAAALGLSAIAAQMALTWRGGLTAGEHVLVLGASGTVGQAGVQLARIHGAARVVAACRDPHGLTRAAELGADAVVDLSGTDTGEIADRMRDSTAGRLDLVLDPLWGRPAEAALSVLSPNGRLVNLGSSAGPSASLGSATVRSGMMSILGYTNNALTSAQKAAALEQIFGYAAQGRLTTDRVVLPLVQIAEAWSQCGQAPHRRAVMIPR